MLSLKVDQPIKKTFGNVIQNFDYGNKVYVVTKGLKKASVTIEDDGPGIRRSI